MARGRAPRSPFPQQDGVDAARLTLPPGPWRTVAEHLVDRLGPVGADGVARLLAEGRVRGADGASVDDGTPYRPGGTVWVRRELEVEPVVPLPMPVLHEDERLVVVDKPPFLASTRGVGTCARPRWPGRGARPAAPTSSRPTGSTGSPPASSCSSPTRRPAGPTRELFARREVAKTYLALAPVRAVLGLPTTVALHLTKDRGELRARVVPGRAPNSETRVELVGERAGLGLYRLTPTTGRTHQLRVHLAHLGVPIVHDPLYGAPDPAAPDAPDAPDDLARPLGLLAARLALTDPLDRGRRVLTTRRTLPGWSHRGPARRARRAPAGRRRERHLECSSCPCPRPRSPPPVRTPVPSTATPSATRTPGWPTGGPCAAGLPRGRERLRRAGDRARDAAGRGDLRRDQGAHPGDRPVRPGPPRRLVVLLAHRRGSAVRRPRPGRGRRVPQRPALDGDAPPDGGAGPARRERRGRRARASSPSAPATSARRPAHRVLDRHRPATSGSPSRARRRQRARPRHRGVRTSATGWPGRSTAGTCSTPGSTTPGARSRSGATRSAPPRTTDVLVVQEDDVRFTLGLGTSRDDRWVVVATGSSTTNEVRLLDAADVTAGRCSWPSGCPASSTTSSRSATSCSSCTTATDATSRSPARASRTAGSAPGSRSA